MSLDIWVENFDTVEDPCLFLSCFLVQLYLIILLYCYPVDQGLLAYRMTPFESSLY